MFASDLRSSSYYCFYSQKRHDTVVISLVLQGLSSSIPKRMCSERKSSMNLAKTLNRDGIHDWAVFSRTLWVNFRFSPNSPFEQTKRALSGRSKLSHNHNPQFCIFLNVISKNKAATLNHKGTKMLGLSRSWSSSVLFL